jgi:hypothetical protein
VQRADAAPNEATVRACGEKQQELRDLRRRWRDLKASDVQALNERLRKEGLSPLTP